MKKLNIGVVEGFFGPQWQMDKRLSYASFLAQTGGAFYIYAPKQDARLRKAWREVWSHEYIESLKMMGQTFREQQIAFGVGFSPFGMGSEISQADELNLKNKMDVLNQIGIDILGVFFDDMPVSEQLAEMQLAVIKVIQQQFSGRIIFCPSFYSYDPILEKVFGQMPKNYWPQLAEQLPEGIEIAWTGPKVISPSIDQQHLLEVSDLFKRAPFIWENLFANDGPKNCKFLKLKSFSGRDQHILTSTTGVGLNMMNQAELSKITFLASLKVCQGKNSDEAFEEALSELCSPAFKKFLLANRDVFLQQGLDQISEEAKQIYLEKLSKFSEPAAREIIEWLMGTYNVGSECLTD